MSKKSELLRREGFWNDKRDSYPELPMPIESSEPWKGKKEFLSALDELEGSLRRRPYRGWSDCRCCGVHNGTADYEHDGWKWPEGFRHYVASHNIRPSLAFQEMVLGKYIGKYTP